MRGEGKHTQTVPRHLPGRAGLRAAVLAHRRPHHAQPGSRRRGGCGRPRMGGCEDRGLVRQGKLSKTKMTIVTATTTIFLVTSPPSSPPPSSSPSPSSPSSLEPGPPSSPSASSPPPPRPDATGSTVPGTSPLPSPGASPSLRCRPYTVPSEGVGSGDSETQVPPGHTAESAQGALVGVHATRGNSLGGADAANCAETAEARAPGRSSKEAERPERWPRPEVGTGAHCRGGVSGSRRRLCGHRRRFGSRNAPRQLLTGWDRVAEEGSDGVWLSHITKGRRFIPRPLPRARWVIVPQADRRSRRRTAPKSPGPQGTPGARRLGHLPEPRSIPLPHGRSGAALLTPRGLRRRRGWRQGQCGFSAAEAAVARPGGPPRPSARRSASGTSCHAGAQETLRAEGSTAAQERGS